MEFDIPMYRGAFEVHILNTHKPRADRNILELTEDNEDYLDLYVHYEWLGWKAARLCTR
jgi:hypothetical protein